MELFSSPFALLGLLLAVVLIVGVVLQKFPVKAVMGMVHLFLMTSTFMLSCYTYNQDIQLGFSVPDWMYYFVGFGVLGISGAMALGHVISGGFMGMAAGGMADGMRLGLILGLGLGVGRMWPYAFLWTGGAVLFSPSIWHIVLLVLGSLVCLGINTMVKFFWGRVQA